MYKSDQPTVRVLPKTFELDLHCIYYLKFTASSLPCNILIQRAVNEGTYVILCNAHIYD